MINKYAAKKYCKEDISLIENYDKAIADTTQVWHCHHRDEVKVLPSGMTVICSRQNLIENDRYYNCPANELIFLTKSEHLKLHGAYKTTDHRRKIAEANKNKKLSEETRRKLSESHKGQKHSEESYNKMSESKKGKTHSNFGKVFIEHYGITCTDNIKLYAKEYTFYKYHGHFSWEDKHD